MSETTTFLFAVPSVTEGLARLVDLAGVYDDYNYSQLADLIALALDWQTVGNDLREAVAAELQRQSLELAS